ncbi:MAG: CHAT domain-containing protein, partial [Planctomycetota bacterium]
MLRIPPLVHVALPLAALALLSTPALGQGDAAVEELRAVLEFAEVLRDEGDAEALREVLTEAGTLATAIPTHLAAAVQPQAQLDRLAFEAGVLPVQLIAREWALAYYEQTEPVDDFNLAAAQHNLAVLKRKLGHIAEAHELADAVHTTFARILPADDVSLLMAKQNLAVIKNDLGDIEGAFALERYVLEARTRLFPAEHPQVLDAKLNLASTQVALGDPEAARNILEDVHRSYARLDPNHPSALAAQLNLGTVRMRLGDVAGAVELFESVHDAYERSLPPEHPLVLSAKANLAVSLKKDGEAERAQELEEHVWRMRKKIFPEGSLQIFAALHNIGVTRVACGQYAEAVDALEQVVEAYDEQLPDGHPFRVGADQSLAAALLELGEGERALELFTRVTEAVASSRPKGHEERLIAEQNLALAELRFGDSEEAAVHGRAMVAGMHERLRQLLVASPRRASETCASEAERVSDALFLEANGLLTAQELFDLIETRRHVSTATLGSRGSVDADGDGQRMRTRWAQLSRQLGDLVVGGPADAASAAAWRAEIARLSQERDLVLRGFVAARRGTGLGIERVSHADVANALPAGAGAVGFLRYRPRVLDAESRTTNWGPDQLVALVVPDEGAVRRLDLGPAAKVERLVEEWRASVGEPVGRGTGVEGRATESRHDASRRAGRALARAVLEPVLDAVGASRVFVCSDDVLHLVPLDALPLEEGRLVGDAYRISREVSFGSLAHGTARDVSGPGLLVVGDVDFDHMREDRDEKEENEDDEASGSAAPEGANSRAVATASRVPIELVERSGAFGSWIRLAGTAGEADALAALFERHFEVEPKVLRRGAATKAALLKHAVGKRYVHVATHGWFAPEQVLALGDRDVAERAVRLQRTVVGFAPMTLSGLCFAGANRGRDELGGVPGLMTAEELATVDLSRCELAVLSACETHVGIRRAGLGIQSLQAALHAAGARTTLTSLWKVDDDLTRQLMEAFYASLWSEGTPVGEALWKAKSTLRERGAPVGAWSGWVFTGARDYSHAPLAPTPPGWVRG